MKARPRYSDFKLDYDKFPVRQLGGIADMNAIKRMDYRDAIFERANDEWMDEAETKIKELKALLNEYLNPDGQGDTFDDRVKQALNKD